MYFLSILCRSAAPGTRLNTSGQTQRGACAVGSSTCLVLDVVVMESSCEEECEGTGYPNEQKAF